VGEEQRLFQGIAARVQNRLDTMLVAPSGDGLVPRCQHLSNQKLKTTCGGRRESPYLMGSLLGGLDSRKSIGWDRGLSGLLHTCDCTGHVLRCF
jgi:hypothetical protein